jgi:hypothetical protein
MLVTLVVLKGQSHEILMAFSCLYRTGIVQTILPLPNRINFLFISRFHVKFLHFQLEAVRSSLDTTS